MKEKKQVKDWFLFFAPRFYLLSLIYGVIVRIVLLLEPGTTVAGFDAVTWFRVFGIGAVNDIAFGTLALVPAFLIYSLFNDWKFRKPFGYVIGGGLLALTVYVIFFNDITDEYAGVVPMIADILLGVLTVSFLLKLFIPKIRSGWRHAFIAFLMLLYFFLMVLNAISEAVFWDEIGVRYNFIAVDYLVYTNEVIGNIMESYPMVPILLGVAALAVGIFLLFTRRHSLRGAGIGGLKTWAVGLALMTLSFGCVKWLHWSYLNPGDYDNIYAAQIQDNGCWNFLEAYNSSELDFKQFYPTLPEGEAGKAAASALGLGGAAESASGSALPALAVRFPGDPIKKNIVLVTMESMSASFLAAYGNTLGITPTLDSLVKESLVFDNLFATGNRTVRGLEAVTLCIPPGSGESIVKRPDNANLFSTGSVLRSLGYTTTYYYGGDSYFDNMETFFSGNGYTVRDKKNYGAENITFDNIWGCCDQDSYRVALSDFDACAASGQPFFAHIMTISNHRPYTYPEGTIEYDGNPMSRQAAVKYTDWALGGFLAEAARRPWFHDTVFVIVADHCASSAGKTSIPLRGYHIPALVYAPGFVEPCRVSKLCSQIDLMPTLFSLLHFSYDSEFFGRDILADDFRERAYMATYQDLGYYADGLLTVLSPVRRSRQFYVREEEGWQYVEEPLGEASDPSAAAHFREAVALYETASTK